MIPWTQMEAGWTTHPKVQELTWRLHDHDDPNSDGLIEAVGYVSVLWDYAARWCPDGDITKKLHLLPMLWRRGEDRSATVLQHIIGVGLLDDNGGTITIHGWEERYSEIIERQEAKREATKNRVAKWRKAKNQKVTPGNADVTLCNAAVTDVTLLDVDVDVDREVKTSSSVSNEVRDVFTHWQTVMGKSDRTRLTRLRREQIGRHLKAYGLEGVKRGLSNLATSDHHRGSYDDFDTNPLKAVDRFEKWVLGQHPRPNNGQPQNADEADALLQSLTGGRDRC